jgi:hypothetical protein
MQRLRVRDRCQPDLHTVLIISQWIDIIYYWWTCLLTGSAQLIDDLVGFDPGFFMYSVVPVKASF